MRITLYENLSESIVVNKTLNEIMSLEGELRNSTSLINPDILVEFSDEYVFELIDDIEVDNDDIGFLESSKAFKANYAYIPELGRYYYINDIGIYNNRLFTLSMSVDVLMSYKDSFLKLNALIERNEFTYSKYIEDDKMPYHFNQRVDEYNLGNNGKFNPALDIASLNYFITVFENGAPYDVSRVDSPVDDLPDVTFTSAGRNKFQTSYATTWADVNRLADLTINNESNLSFVISLIAYPFELSTSGHYRTLTLGNTIEAGVTVYDLNKNISDYVEVASFYVQQYTGWDNGYMDFEPYSTYELYLPYYGYIELKSSDIINSLIKVFYSFDYTNGTAKINVYNKTKEYTIKSVTANIGIKISMNRTNNQQLNDEKTQLAIKSSISAIASVASIAGGAITKNPFLIANGVTGLSSTIVDSATKLSMMHERASTANNTGYEGLYGCQDVKLKVTRYTKREPINYAHYYGRPLNETYTLNTREGYTLIKDIHLDGIKCTKTELDELMSLLTSGIIL